MDPTALFCGTVVEESEVLPSKQAPVMLVCAWDSSWNHDGTHWKFVAVEILQFGFGSAPSSKLAAVQGKVGVHYV